MTRDNSLSFDQVLRARVQQRGGDPLLTYYRPDAGTRIELSARTFANWVDKTANLVADELGLVEGDRAIHALATSHPGHWVSLVWTAALWQVGVVVSPGPQGGSSGADLVVVGPEAVTTAVPSPSGPGTDGTPSPAGDHVVACSLHPLGLGFSTPLPDGILDYGAEVPSQPDVYVAAPASPGAPLWQEAGAERDWASVREAAAELSGPVAGPHPRRLVRPTDAFATLVSALVVPVMQDGSAVVVDGVVEDRAVREIAAAEHAD